MKTKKPLLRRLWLGFVMLLLTLYSCDNQLQIIMPEGPEGPQGPSGKSSYEVWKDAVENGTIEWDKSQVEVVDYFVFLKGKDGKDGQNGQDGKDGLNGKSAYEFWVELVKEGSILKDGKTWSEERTSVPDFWDYLSGADGKNGTTPEIGGNGNWFIGDQDTGVPAAGKDGQDGKDGLDGSVVTIENGNWHIDGTDTGIPATGTSAYEQWVKDVTSSTGLLNPHADDGSNWPDSETSLTDFWKYLRGRDGKDGVCDCTTPKVNYIQPMKKASIATTLADDAPKDWVNNSDYAAYEGYAFLPAEAVTDKDPDMVTQITIPFWRQRIEFSLSCELSDIEVVLKGKDDLTGSWIDETKTDVDYEVTQDGQGIFTHIFRISFEANDLPGEQFRELTLRFRKIANTKLYKDIKIRQVYLPNMLSRYAKANVAELNTFGTEITEANFNTLTGDQVGYAYQWGRNMPIKWGVKMDPQDGKLMTENDPVLWNGTDKLLVGANNTGYFPESGRKAGATWSSKIAAATDAPATYVGVNTDKTAVAPGATPYGDPCPAGWHLPNRDEYYAFVIGYKDLSSDETAQFGRPYNATSVSEAYSGTTSDTYSGARWDYWKKSKPNAQYKASGTYTAHPNGYETFKPIYAVKFISTKTNDVYENALQGAFKYEILNKGTDKGLNGIYYLKISYRHLGEYTTLTAAELETKSENDGYWESDNANDITAIVPLFGYNGLEYIYGSGYTGYTFTYSYDNASSYLWSSEIRAITRNNPNAVTFLTDGSLRNVTRNDKYQRRSAPSAAWSFSHDGAYLLRCIKNAQDPEIPATATTLPKWNN